MTVALHKVVVAAIIDRGGKILAHQRPPGKWGAGKWEFPGGKLERGEDPREALRRECREELGVDVEVGAPCDVIMFTYDDGPVLLLFFHATIVKGEPRALLSGAIDWASPHELASYDWLEADWPLVHRLASLQA